MISINGADKEKRRNCMEEEQVSEHKNERNREKDKWECMCVYENKKEKERDV